MLDGFWTLICVTSVTRWLDYFFNFGHLQQWKLTQYLKIIDRVGSKFCQMLNKPLQNWPWFLKYCQSGEILPNLVTLHKTENVFLKFRSNGARSYVQQLRLKTISVIRLGDFLTIWTTLQIFGRFLISLAIIFGKMSPNWSNILGIFLIAPLFATRTTMI